MYNCNWFQTELLGRGLYTRVGAVTDSAGVCSGVRRFLRDTCVCKQKV